MTAGGEVAVFDPYHPYAVRFLETFHRKFGARAVCLHSSRVGLREQAWQYPQLHGDLVTAHYLVPDDIAAIAAALRERQHVVAVLPFLETVVEQSSRLAAELGLDWAQPEVLARFRDKYALKAYLAALPDGPRINAIAAVHTVQDVRDAVDATGLDRYVIKPNDGFGNSRIGFFDRDSDPAAIAAHLTTSGDAGMLLEEFLEGPEYYVNGQVDAHGQVTVVDVSRYRRGMANGRANVALGSVRVARSEPSFTPIAEYVSHVVRASGLRRSPFHAELILDERGPCLLEIGGRLAGGHRALDDNLLHGTLDVFDLAAHYYWTADDYGRVPLDWERYDATTFVHVSGVVSQNGRVRAVEGRGAVEAMPEFRWWVTAPEIGAKLVPTVDILRQPWHATFAGTDAAGVEGAALQARALLRINEDRPGPGRWWRALAARWPLVRRKLAGLRGRTEIHARSVRVGAGANRGPAPLHGP